MEEQQIREGNKLIIEFMGVKVEVVESVFGDIVHCYRIGKFGKATKERGIKYHSSWDWLMPVVEKIETLHDCIFSFFIVQTECDIACSTKYKDNGDDWDAPSFAQKKGDKLLSTWSAVIEFIKWYNQNH